jgi:hypothetical protein
MQVGNYDVLYFNDVESCFETYGLIVDSFKDWERPYQVNEGYVIYYNPKLNEILDIENYEIRRIMNVKMNLFNDDEN